MGCVCCSLSSFVSILLDALERATLCTVCALLTCCLLFTILFVMVVGVGVGYHYCFVQSSVDAMARAAKAAGALRAGQPESGPVMRSLERQGRRGTQSRIKRALEDLPPVLINQTEEDITTSINKQATAAPSVEKSRAVDNEKPVIYNFGDVTPDKNNQTSDDNPPLTNNRDKATLPDTNKKLSSILLSSLLITKRVISSNKTIPPHNNTKDDILLPLINKRADDDANENISNIPPLSKPLKIFPLNYAK